MESPQKYSVADLQQVRMSQPSLPELSRGTPFLEKSEREMGLVMAEFTEAQQPLSAFQNLRTGDPLSLASWGSE